MRKFAMYIIQIIVLLGGCGPLQPAPAPMQPVSSPKMTSTPIATLIPIPTVLPTITPTLISPEIENAQLEEIHMTDQTSGWAWAFDHTSTSYLLHTSDGALTWENVTPDEYTQDQDVFSDAFFLNGHIGWMALFHRSTGDAYMLMWTTDGGNSWVPVNRDMQALKQLDYSEMSFEDEKNGWWKTVLTGAGNVYKYYYRTKDGGASWELVTLRALEGMLDNGLTIYEDGQIEYWSLQVRAFYFDLSHIIYTDGLTTLFVTRDLGKTWQKIELTGLPDTMDSELSWIENPTFFDAENGVLPIIVRDQSVDATQVFIYGTQDGGLTWRLESGPTLVARGTADMRTEFISRLNGFLIVDENVSITHDGGKTWRLLALPEDFKSSETARIDVYLNFVNPMTGWTYLTKISRQTSLSIDRRLLKTTDGGLTWTELSPTINP
jgi:photosystem II stability/assembly factor-like uncharacterized protein